MTPLKWALIFFLVSVAAGLLGFTGISAATADIARFLFYVFVVIFLVLLVLRSHGLSGVAFALRHSGMVREHQTSDVQLHTIVRCLRPE